MGLVKRDLITKNIEHDAVYSHGPEGAAHLLEDMRRLRTDIERGASHMSDAIALLVDLETAVTAPHVLTPRQLQIVALVYTHELTAIKTAYLLDAKRQSVSRSMEAIHARLATHLAGVDVPVRKVLDVAEAYTVREYLPQALRNYLVNVAEGRTSPLKMMPQEALEQLRDRVSDRGSDADPQDEPYRYTFADATLNYRAALLAEYPYYSGQPVHDEAGRYRYTIPSESVMERKQKHTAFCASPDAKMPRVKRSQKRTGRGETVGCDEDLAYGSAQMVRRGRYGFEVNADFRVWLPSDGDIRKFGDQWTYERGWGYGRGPAARKSKKSAS